MSLACENAEDQMSLAYRKTEKRNAEGEEEQWVRDEP